MPYILVDGQAEADFWGGLERIRFDPTNPEAVPETTCLLENNGGYLARYNVRTRWNEPGLRIEYHRNDNQHLFDERPELLEEEIIWGVHILTIESGAECGPSRWQADGEPECDGPGWRMEAISGGPRNRRKGTVLAIQRGLQGQFRQWLVAKDKHCAVTGETCESVLEAAHIVPAHKGGCEVPSNGILLRADIHRLFDANPPRFAICPEDGRVIPLNGFRYGSANLEGAQIPPCVYRRVAQALVMRTELCRSC